MKKEYLENYHEEELESYKKYEKKYLSGEITKESPFPELSRFGKINDPIVKPELSTYELDGEKKETLKRNYDSQRTTKPLQCKIPKGIWFLNKRKRSKNHSSIYY
jgi:hypothetical protein